MWDSYNTGTADQHIHLFAFAKLQNKASSLWKQLHAASVKPPDKSLFTKQTEFLWDTRDATKQNWTSQTACLFSEMAKEPLKFPLAFKHTNWEKPTAGHQTCCVRGWWLLDFPQRLRQEEPAPHLQEMGILRWLSCIWPLSKGTEKEVTAPHFCRALQSHSRAGCALPAQLMCTGMC